MANNRLIYSNSAPSIQYVYDVAQIDDTPIGLIDLHVFGVVMNYNVGDVVLIYSPLNGSTPNEFIPARIYDVVVSNVSDMALRCSYDNTIYSYNPSVSYGAVLYTDHDVAKNIEGCSSSHSIRVSLSNAAYSNRYVLYSSKRTHSLTINDVRRRFFDDVSNYSEALNAQNLFFVDDCAGVNGAAYKLFLEDSSFDLLNNKFKKTIEFTLAS